MSAIEPFQIHVDNGVLQDLRERLDRWRPTPSLVGDGWTFGVDTEWLASLVEHWRTTYDWRAVEHRINAYPQFRTEIDGQTIHFLHIRGTGPSPMPIVLTHGWPWTFWDFEKVIGPLTDPAAHGGDAADSFDVIIPSLTGYGFSTPLSRPGLTYVDTADLWARLMTEVLGYRRFAAHGGDWGALVTSQLGHKHAESLFGIHMAGACAARPTTAVPSVAVTSRATISAG